MDGDQSDPGFDAQDEDKSKCDALCALPRGAGKMLRVGIGTVGVAGREGEPSNPKSAARSTTEAPSNHSRTKRRDMQSSSKLMS